MKPRISWMVAPMLGAVLTTVVSAAPAQASPPPPIFQIENLDLTSFNGYRTCAYATSTNRVRTESCSLASLSQRFIYNPLTSQITSGRASTLGRCLDVVSSGVSLYAQFMPCDTSDPNQKWEVTNDGVNDFLQVEGSNGGKILATFLASSNVDAKVYDYADNPPPSAFPVLS